MRENSFVHGQVVTLGIFLIVVVVVVTPAMLKLALGLRKMGLRRGPIEGTDLAFFLDISVINGLHISVVVVSLIDELCQFLQVFLLDVDQFSRDEPVHSLSAGRSGQ